LASRIENRRPRPSSTPISASAASVTVFSSGWASRPKFVNTWAVTVFLAASTLLSLPRSVGPLAATLVTESSEPSASQSVTTLPAPKSSSLPVV
jgi:hypothetical protein